MRLDFTPLAREDLKQIYKYIGRRSRNGARSIQRAFTEAFNLLLAQPRHGRSRPDLAPGLRSVPVGNYIVFYTEFENQVRIYRVLHAARDIEAIFQEEE
jgi:toxin ParE1/3/4